MLYMMSWKIIPGCYKQAVERFLDTGAPVPEGMVLKGRWHAPGSANGWLLVEGTTNQAAEHAAEWADLLMMETTPVLEDMEAGAVAKGLMNK